MKQELKMPKFKNEDGERNFWAKLGLSKHFEPSDFERVSFPNLAPSDFIQRKIYQIRGRKVMFDSDLAALYGVATKNLNKAVSRNKERFPGDFMFQLTKKEFENLKFQTGTSSLVSQNLIPTPGSWGGQRYSPHVFTEQGVAMLSSPKKENRVSE